MFFYASPLSALRKLLCSCKVYRNWSSLVLSLCSIFSFTAEGAHFIQAVDLREEDVCFLKKAAKTVYDDALHARSQSLQGVETTSSRENIDGRQVTKYPFKGSTGLSGTQQNIGFILKPIDYNGLVVAFHGSLWVNDWVTDFNPGFGLFWRRRPIQEARGLDLAGAAHGGFMKAAQSCYEPMMTRINEVLRDLEGQDIYFVGHSLGGALAILTAASFVKRRTRAGMPMRPNQVKVVVFSCPRVGDRTLVEEIHELVGKNNILNFKCAEDVVSAFPLGPEVGIQVEGRFSERLWEKIRGFEGIVSSSSLATLQTPGGATPGELVTALKESYQFLSTIPRIVLPPLITACFYRGTGYRRGRLLIVPATSAGAVGQTAGAFAVCAHSIPSDNLLRVSFREFKRNVLVEHLEYEEAGRFGFVQALMSSIRNPLIRFINWIAL